MSSPGTKSNQPQESRTGSGTDVGARTHWNTHTEGTPERRWRKLPLRTGIIYGPVESRRLGVSLGINLLPTTYKLCSFNCIYCQYGWTKKATMSLTEELKDLPQPEEVKTALEAALVQLSQSEQTVDSITICGNGEPTLYPNLLEVIEAARRLQEQYQPQARLAILSNSSTVVDKAIRDALDLLDLKVMKFDAGSEEMFQQLNHPGGPIYMGEIVAGLKTLKNIYLQSLFVQGRVTNADPDSVSLWVEKVREIRPLGVQVYTLEREPADEKLERVNLATLEWIANQVHWQAGVPADVF